MSSGARHGAQCQCQWLQHIMIGGVVMVSGPGYIDGPYAMHLESPRLYYRTLELSFNEIEGTIPTELARLSNLKYATAVSKSARPGS